MQLIPEAQRVLGCLIEKSLATPQQYPLSINALRTACNQTTNRDPVVRYTDADVERGLADLRTHQLVRTSVVKGSRTPKYEHLVAEALGIDTAGIAVLGVLLVRGPQTVGELRTRTERQHPFADVGEVDEVLAALAAHPQSPVAERLERQPGQKEARHAHRLGIAAGGDPMPAPVAPATAPVVSPPPPVATSEEPAPDIAALRTEVAELRAEVAELRAEIRDR